ncbi:MAG: hypothetical protein J2P48_18650 [Alphaproteobacteria bacterium]|nr:hypothetical protein [Alphaproteobacteria bacterium]
MRRSLTMWEWSNGRKIEGPFMLKPTPITPRPGGVSWLPAPPTVVPREPPRT